MKYRLTLILSILLIVVTSTIVGKEDVYCKDRYGRIHATDTSSGSGSTTNASNSGSMVNPSNVPISGNGSTRDRGKKNKAWIDCLKTTIVKGGWRTITLRDASKSGVSWSCSSNIVKLKKRGNKVDVIARKPGRCTVKAIYKGKTFACKVRCLDSDRYDILKTITHEPFQLNQYSQRGAIILDCTREWLDSGAVEIHFLNYDHACDGRSVSYYVEDPGVITCEWGEAWVAPNGTKTVRNLFVGALRPGSTRIVITNNYNKEKEYISIKVANDYNNGKCLIDIDPNYNPITQGEREYFNEELDLDTNTTNSFIIAF